MSSELLTPFERIECVINAAFGGRHHVDGLKEFSQQNAVEFRVYDMATFDGGVLTRLVLAAHHWGVRAEVSPAMRHLRVSLSARRTRDAQDRFFNRHPDMRTVLAEWEKREGAPLADLSEPSASPREPSSETAR